MIIRENENAIEAYRVPSCKTSVSFVKRDKKKGMIPMLTTVITMPCTTENSIPCVAARSAFLTSPAPRHSAIRAFMPTPKPIAIALIKFWTGYTSDSAVIACSLICATKKLSIMLYKEFTSMEITIGSAMLVSSGNTGFSFIKDWFIKYSILQTILKKV